MSKQLYLLYESATGYAVFQRVSNEEIGASDLELQNDLQKLSQFSKMVKLVSFSPFTDPANALQDCICIAEGLLSESLAKFLPSALPKKSQKGWELGVSDPRLGSAIREKFGYDVVSNEMITELARCVRLHAEALLPEHEDGDIARAQCGLSHAFSRNKVKFNVHRNDNMVIQASALLEHMDKGVNLLGMRVKEWYGWHFPELAKEVPDPFKYSRIALMLGNRNSIADREAEEVKADFAAILENDEAVAERVYEKAQTSMGGDMAEVDWSNIETFAQRVTSLAEYKTSLQQYLVDKMMVIAPNLTSLMGHQLGAKLLSKAGSLTNLAKAPASTIQILGAEKALFRALKKKKGNTPKYGIIFHSSFIQRASKENRGKISRYLANKTALACRIDCFMDQPPTVFGEKLRDQVEGRLAFFDTGAKPKSNKEAMAEALEQFKLITKKREKKAAKAREETAEETAAEEPKKKKKRAEE